jgi:hypothetical protein
MDEYREKYRKIFGNDVRFSRVQTSLSGNFFIRPSCCGAKDSFTGNPAIQASGLGARTLAASSDRSRPGAGLTPGGAQAPVQPCGAAAKQRQYPSEDVAAIKEIFFYQEQDA